MEVQEKQVTLRHLVPSEGMYLTQSAEVADKDRIVCSEVYLAAKASDSDYKEITAEEKATIEAARDAAIEAAREAAIKANQEAAEAKSKATETADAQEVTNETTNETTKTESTKAAA